MGGAEAVLRGHAKSAARRRVGNPGAEAVRKALAENRALAVSLELPLGVAMREGKEFVRDGDGRALGAVETTFVSLAWDRSQGSA